MALQCTDNCTSTRASAALNLLRLQTDCRRRCKLSTGGAQKSNRANQCQSARLGRPSAIELKRISGERDFISPDGWSGCARVDPVAAFARLAGRPAAEASLTLVLQSLLVSMRKSRVRPVPALERRQQRAAAEASESNNEQGRLLSSRARFCWLVAAAVDARQSTAHKPVAVDCSRARQSD